MRIALFLFLGFITSISFSQVLQESIESKKLGEIREFSITLPIDYEKNIDKKYPILLVLDGEYLTNTFAGILQYGAYWDDLPEMIIISVYQNYADQRLKDSEFDEAGLPSGNGSNFYEFIGLELLPYIEKKYRTDPFKIIAGHDMTAGFLNFYLYKDNPVFNGYISIAPEMAPKMENRISERLSLITKPIFYYLASGEADTPEYNRKIEALNKNITSISNRNFKYRFDQIPAATHYSLVPQAIPKSLYFIFDGYQPISMLEYKEKIAKLDSGYTQYLINKYTILEEKIGLKVKPRLSDFKAIEAAIVKNKAYDELHELSKYAEKQYPKTTLSVYHKALYYEKVGEFNKAANEYKKAFTKEEVRELTKDFMLSRAEKLKNKVSEPKVEEHTEPLPEEGDKKEIEE